MAASIVQRLRLLPAVRSGREHGFKPNVTTSYNSRPYDSTSTVYGISCWLMLLSSCVYRVTVPLHCDADGLACKVTCIWCDRAIPQSIIIQQWLTGLCCKMCKCSPH